MQVNETQESCLKAQQSLSICQKVMNVLLSPLAEVAGWQEIKLNTDSDYQ